MEFEEKDIKGLLEYFVVQYEIQEKINKKILKDLPPNNLYHQPSIEQLASLVTLEFNFTERVTRSFYNYIVLGGCKNKSFTNLSDVLKDLIKFLKNVDELKIKGKEGDLAVVPCNELEKDEADFKEQQFSMYLIQLEDQKKIITRWHDQLKILANCSYPIISNFHTISKWVHKLNRILTMMDGIELPRILVEFERLQLEAPVSHPPLDGPPPNFSLFRRPSPLRQKKAEELLEDESKEYEIVATKYSQLQTALERVLTEIEKTDKNPVIQQISDDVERLFDSFKIPKDITTLEPKEVLNKIKEHLQDELKQLKPLLEFRQYMKDDLSKKLEAGPRRNRD